MILSGCIDKWAWLETNTKFFNNHQIKKKLKKKIYVLFIKYAAIQGHRFQSTRAKQCI